MQLNVAPESFAALKADGTMRCLLDIKYQPTSRQSSVAIPLANDLVDEFRAALVAQLGQTTAADGAASTTADYTANVQLNVVQLRRNRILVCFDLFPCDCKPEVRREVDESAARPIHAVVESGNVYHVRRHPALDARVARRYAVLQDVDKGPRPYFSDSRTPTIYIDGVRVEAGVDGVTEDELRSLSED